MRPGRLAALLALFLSGCLNPPTPPEKAIFDAVQAGDAAAVRELLARDKGLVNARSSGSWSKNPLHLAASVEVARALLDAGADANAKDAMGWTPLHRTSDGAVAQLLLERGADPAAAAQRGVTPLHTTPSAQVARLLLARGVAVDMRADEDRTPLFTQIEDPGGIGTPEARAEVVKVLLEAGGDPRFTRRINLQTPLHAAASFGRREIVQLLLARGANVNATDKLGGTPLHNAALKDHVAVAESLLARGADTRARLSRHAAVQTVRIGGGGGVSSREAGGATPLAVARSEAMKALLKRHGATE